MIFYIISDVHGFYNEMRTALDEAGFDPNDENSWLVSLGDELDRGPKSKEVVDYLTSLERAIFVKGNHTSLFEECCRRGYPESFDYHNGTARTIIDLAPNAENFYDACHIAMNMVEPLHKKMVNYYETANYIFVHSFIALKCNDNLPIYYTRNRKFEFDPDWRHAHNSAWEIARWGNPYELAEKRFLPNKTLIFGHFHTSWPRHKYKGESEFGSDADFSPYYGDGYIAIDACCAASGKLNCIVIKDDFIDGKSM